MQKNLSQSVLTESLMSAKVEFAYAEGAVKGGLYAEVDVLDILQALVDKKTEE